MIIRKVFAGHDLQWNVWEMIQVVVFRFYTDIEGNCISLFPRFTCVTCLSLECYSLTRKLKQLDNNAKYNQQ